MKTAMSLSIVFWGAMATSALAQPAEPDRRVPNMTEKQRYPRWLPPVALDAVKGDSYIYSRPFEATFALDSRNIVHAAGRADFVLRYYNTAFTGGSATATRRASGFSQGEVVSSLDPFTVDIAVGPDNLPRILCEENGKRIHFRKTASVWRKTEVLIPSGSQEFKPGQILVDEVGVSHIMIIRDGPLAADKTIVYFTVTPDLTEGATTDILASFPRNDGYIYPLTASNLRMALSPGKVHAIWSEQINGGTDKIRYSVGTGASWSPPIPAQDDPSMNGFQGDLAVDPTDANAVHLAWKADPVSGDSDRVYYKKLKADNTVLVPKELVSTGAPSLDTVRIVVDSQKQPHVVWGVDGTQTLNYAARLERFWTSGTPWQGRQEPAEFVELSQPFIPNDMSISRNDTLHVFGDNNETEYKELYTRTMEPNLGSQDPATMVGVGRNASANLANGNLHFSLPLFASAGVGVPTSFGLYYNSQQEHPTVLSQGWSHSFLMYLVDSQTSLNGSLGEGSADMITLVLPDGRSIVFQWENLGGTPPQMYHIARDEYGYFGRIERQAPINFNSDYVLTTKAGEKYTFGPTGFLHEVKDANNNTSTLSYTNGRLSSVVDSTSRSTTFSYNSEGKLEEVVDYGTKKYRFAYSSSGALQSVTLNYQGQVTPVWQFAYHTAHDPALKARLGLLSTVTTPGSDDFRYFYYKDNRFSSSRDPVLTQPSVGTGTQHPDQYVNYTDPADPSVFPEDPDGYATTATAPKAQFTNRRSIPFSIVFEQRRCLARKVTDPTGSVLRNFSTETESLFFRNLKKMKDKLGNQTVYLYRHEDGGGGNETPSYVKDLIAKVFMPPPNSTPGSGPDMTNPVASYTYSNNVFRTLTATDAKGKVTKYHYDDLSSAPADPAANVMVGNLTEIAYPTVAGVVAVEKYGHDGMGRVVRHTTPENVSQGTSAMFVYGDATTGLVTQIYRPEHGSPEQFGYDVMGNVTSHTLPLGGMTTILLDGLYRTKTKTDPAGDEVSSTEYTYTLDGAVETVSGPGTAFSKSFYDELGRVLKTETLASSGSKLTTRYHYDAEGNVREVHDPNGKIATTTYDELNRPDIETRPGNPGPAIITDLDYDFNGNVIKRKIGGRQTTYAYYARNNLKLSVNSDGTRDEMTYDERDQVEISLHKSVDLTSKSGTKSVYDERGRLKATTQLTNFAGATGFTTIYTHDKNSNVVKVTDPILKTRSFTFDRAGRQVRTLDHNLQVVSEVVYNDNDLRDLVKTPHPETGALVVSQRFTYNLRNQLKTSTDILGNVTSYTYNSLGQRVLQQTPSAGGAICLNRTDHDNLGRVLRQVHDPGSSTQVVWAHEYDNNGNRVQTTDPKGNVYKFRYDDANRLVTLEYPPVAGGAFVESWGYDDRSNMVSHIDPEGKIASFQYDIMDRLISETHIKSGVMLASISRTYDDSSNLLEVHDSISRVMVSFTDDSGNPGYDILNRLTHVRWFLEVGTPDQVMWKKVSYVNSIDGSPGYDAAGNLVAMIDPEGHSYEYAYDVENRLTDIRRTRAGGTESLVASFSFYQVSGLRKEILLGDKLKQTYHYDAKERLSSIECANIDGMILSRFDYEYDERDRRKKAKLEHLNCHISYTYDCRDQLTGENWTGNATPPSGSCPDNTQALTLGNISSDSNTTCVTPGNPTAVPSFVWSCTYDPAGNRETKTVGGTTTSYTTDAQNRLISETTSGVTTNYAYDKNGNQISRTVGSIEEVLAYDYANRLKTYERKVSSSTTVSYLYRTTPTGERLAKINLLGSTDNEEWFMYDGQDATADYTRTSTSIAYQIRRTYVNGRSIDSKIARIESSSTETMYFYLSDALGSIHEIADKDGVISRRMLTTAWGEELPGFTPLTSLPDRHGLTQRENDTESGLMHYRARSYDPRLGRFIQKDPITSLAITKPYVYVSNSPVDKTDPQGKWEESGHFWTTYMVARAAGKGRPDAYQLAYYSQLPDEVKLYEATPLAVEYLAGWTGVAGFIGREALYHKQSKEHGVNWRKYSYQINTLLHSLHGGNVLKRRKCLRSLIFNADNLVDQGLLIHAFGDSYAHTYPGEDEIKAYSWPFGHGHMNAGGVSPDQIHLNFTAYILYVHDLFRTLGGTNFGALDKLTRNLHKLDRQIEQNDYFETLARVWYGYDEDKYPYSPNGGLKVDAKMDNLSVPRVQKLLDKMQEACAQQ